MANKIFTFSLRTKSILNAGAVFSTNGEEVGRILSKHPNFKDDWDEMEYDGFYSYDIESSEETCKKVKNGEIILLADEYSISDCNTHWVRGNE